MFYGLPSQMIIITYTYMHTYYSMTYTLCKCSCTVIIAMHTDSDTAIDTVIRTSQPSLHMSSYLTVMKMNASTHMYNMISG